MNSAEKKIAVIEIGNDIWNRAKKAGNQIADGAKQVKDGVVSGGKWIGGALQGEFNDKATVGQIFTDAAISMFPVAGEVTAATSATLVASFITVIKRRPTPFKIPPKIGIIGNKHKMILTQLITSEACFLSSAIFNKTATKSRAAVTSPATGNILIAASVKI